MMPELLKKIEEKFEAMGESPEKHLQGFVHAKPINYWDYVQVDTLLSLQRPRTHFKDEEIFVVYHQITELVLKMMTHELKQLVKEDLGLDQWLNKLERLQRYTSLLINSFDVMKYGMNYDDYNQFRLTLAPASGFQSAQFRFIELYCTRLENLLTFREKGNGSAGPETIEEKFEYLYWKEAGLDREKNTKTLTLRQFEEKYQDGLIRLAREVSGITLEEKVLKMASVPEELKDALRELDYLYNVAWPRVHLQTAQHYLDQKGETKAATGGSAWKRYLHPGFQRRIFFPHLWTEEEKAEWGKEPFRAPAPSA